MVDPARARKVAGRIKTVVADQLEYRVTDERLGFVTVTEVRVTGDLQHASVFYTVLGSPEERDGTAAALERATGRIRTAVGKALGIRLTPSITFIPDGVPEGAAHLDTVIQQAARRDAELAQAAANAQYAGDADPYRVAPVSEPDVEGDPGRAGAEPAGPPPPPNDR